MVYYLRNTINCQCKEVQIMKFYHEESKVAEPEVLVAGGIGAAIAASRSGAKVMLIEKAAAVAAKHRCELKNVDITEVQKILLGNGTEI